MQVEQETRPRPTSHDVSDSKLTDTDRSGCKLDGIKDKGRPVKMRAGWMETRLAAKLQVEGAGLVVDGNETLTGQDAGRKDGNKDSEPVSH